MVWCGVVFCGVVLSFPPQNQDFDGNKKSCTPSRSGKERLQIKQPNGMLHDKRIRLMDVVPANLPIGWDHHFVVFCPAFHGTARSTWAKLR